MVDYNRRNTDGLIDEIHSDIKEVRNDLRQVLQNVNDLCVRLGKAETRMDSMQAEVTEHKDNHKWNIMLAVAVASIVASVISGAFIFLVHH